MSGFEPALGTVMGGSASTVKLTLLPEYTGRARSPILCTARFSPGGGVNVISESVVKALGLRWKVRSSHKTNTGLESYPGPTGISIDTLWEVDVSFSFGSARVYSGEFIVLPDGSAPPYNILLGRDFVDIKNSELFPSQGLRSQAQGILNKLRAQDPVDSSDEIAMVDFEWEVLKFLEEDFELDQNLQDIFVLIGSPDRPEGLTCGEYMSATWPRLCDFVLKTVQSAFESLARQNWPERSYSQQSATSCPGVTLLDFEWSRKGNVEQVYFKIQADIEPLLDFIESIAWLAAALRSTNRSHSGFSVSDICHSISTASLDGDRKRLEWSGWLHSMMELKPVPGPCWHNLFKSPTFVNCDFGRRHVGEADNETNSSQTGYGIKLKLRDMIALADADLLTEYEGGMVYLGYTGVLVPIRKLQSGDVQWHLVSQVGTNKMISLASINTDEVCRRRDLSIDEAAIFNAKAHYLGLWPEALIMLGTEGDCNYPILKQRVYAPDEKVKISDSYTAGLAMNLMTGAPTVNANRSAAYAKSQTTMDYGYKKKTYLRILRDFRSKMVLIFETSRERERAWLVPKLSLVLHAAHICFRSKSGPERLLNYAAQAADGDAAAWQVLEPDEAWDSVKGYLGRNQRDKEELEKLLTRIILNMVKFDAKLVSQAPVSRVHGYNLAKLPSDPKFRPVHTDFTLLPSRQGWWLLTKHVPLYLVHSMAPPVRPDGQALESPLEDLPKNHLICPIACLATINPNEGELLEGKLSNNLYLHCPHEPFDEGTYNSGSKAATALETRLRILCVTRKSDGLRKWDHMPGYMTSAILISSMGRISHKSSLRKEANGDIAIQPELAGVTATAAAVDTINNYDGSGTNNLGESDEGRDETSLRVTSSELGTTETGFDVEFEDPDDQIEVLEEEECNADDGHPGPSSQRERSTPNQGLQAGDIHNEGLDKIQDILPAGPARDTITAEYGDEADTPVTGGKGKEPVRNAPNLGAHGSSSPDEDPDAPAGRTNDSSLPGLSK